MPFDDGAEKGKALDNFTLLDVHRWSDYAVVNNAVDALFDDLSQAPNFGGKPVRTYSVVGLYDDLAEQGRIIRKDQDGLTLEIDQDKLTKKGKAEAINALEEAVPQLKG